MGVVEWIHLDQHSEKWWALVNTVKNRTYLLTLLTYLLIYLFIHSLTHSMVQDIL
jgi:hypothetical protein